jgi:hypothetical protein
MRQLRSKRMVNDILRDFYIHSLLSTSTTYVSHLEHMRLVLQRFKEEGLKLRLKKCLFGVHEIECLGYTVLAVKVSVSTKKVEAVTD